MSGETRVGVIDGGIDGMLVRITAGDMFIEFPLSEVDLLVDELLHAQWLVSQRVIAPWRGEREQTEE
jgi:hypothetical protein